MVALLISFFVSTSVQEGDRWTTERTFRYIAEAEHIDVKKVEKLSYSVLQAGTEVTAISCEQASIPLAGERPVKKILTFKPNGFLFSREDEPDENIERLNRMEWTATEARLGISWARDWPASGNLLEAKVTVKPTSRTSKTLRWR